MQQSEDLSVRLHSASSSLGPLNHSRPLSGGLDILLCGMGGLAAISKVPSDAGTLTFLYKQYDQNKL